MSKYRKDFYEKTCTVCGEDFKSKNPRTKYCSDRCREKPRLEKALQKRSKRCAYRHCNKKFFDPTKQNSQKYCQTGKCQYKESKYRDLERSDEHESSYPPPEDLFLDDQTRECVRCGEWYTPTESSQEYCSEECYKNEKFETRYEDVPDDLSRTVKCVECGREFRGKIPDGRSKGGGHHLQSDHDMSMKEYQDEYENAPIYSEAARWKMREADREFPDDFSETCRQVQLERYESEIVWNKGETKKTHESVARQASKMSDRMSGEDNPFYGKSHSDETRELLSRKNSENWQKPSVRKKMLLFRRKAIKSGKHLSLTHAKVMQGLIEIGLWGEYELDYEVYLTMEDDQPHSIDIASRNQKVAVEIDGCVFHRCPDHGNYERFSSEWQKKIDANVMSDAVVDKSLQMYGWDICRIWEHDVVDDLGRCVEEIASIFDEEIKCNLSYQDIDYEDLDPWIQSLLGVKEDHDLVEYSDEEILTHYRTLGFPYFICSETDIQEDFEELKDFDSGRMESDQGILTVHPSHRKGEKGSRHLMAHRWRTSSKGQESAYSKWQSDEFVLKLIRNRKKHASGVTDSTMRTGLKLLCAVPKIFPSVIAKYVVDEYAPKDADILDPSAGWGSRMVGCLSSSKSSSYVGVEPWEETYDRLEDLKRTLNFGSSSLLFNEAFEEVSLKSKFDLVFTSPPHYDKEHYTDDPNQSDVRYGSYQEWREGFLSTLISKSYRHLRDGGFVILHVTDVRNYPLVEDTRRMMREEGMELESSIKWSRHHVFTNSDRLEDILVAKKST